MAHTTELPPTNRRRPRSSRHRAAALGAAALSVAAVAGCGSTGATTTKVAPPNIVFVLTDDLSLNLVQYMPHVLGLEKTGTTFSNYTVTDSLCCPSRSSIFSGRFPHDTGVFTNTGADGGFNVFHSRGEEQATFATALQAAGYRTAMMGKYLNGYMPADHLGGSSPYVPPGWNEWDVAGNGYGEFNYDLNVNHAVVHHGRAPADYLTSVLSGRASAFVTASAKAHTPFMVEVATFAPHAPYVPAPADASAFPGLTAPRPAAYDTLPTNAPPWLASRTPLTAAEQATITTDFRKRVQDVQSVDRMIADLQATLSAAGVAANTDIVFSSDNGYHMGEYRLTPGKMTAFDTDVNVPLVVSGPGVRSGATVTAPVQNIDLAPTFEAAGHAVTPAAVDGHSLLPLLSAGDASGWRTSSLVEHHGPDTNPADPDHPPKNSGNPPTYNALRTTSYTWVEYVDGSREAYNRLTDPGELHNVAATLPAAAVASLHAALQAGITCHGQAACWAAQRMAPAQL